MVRGGFLLLPFPYVCVFAFWLQGFGWRGLRSWHAKPWSSEQTRTTIARIDMRVWEPAATIGISIATIRLALVCFNSFRSPRGFRSLSLRFLQGFPTSGFGCTGACRVFAFEGFGGKEWRGVVNSMGNFVMSEASLVVHVIKPYRLTTCHVRSFSCCAFHRAL